MTPPAKPPPPPPSGAGTAPSTGQSISTNLRPAWKPGQSGNPSGRAKLPDWLKGKTDELLRVQFRAATEGVVSFKNADGTERLEPVPARDALAAGDRLLDRLIGKPIQTVEPREGNGGVLAALLALAAPPLPTEEEIRARDEQADAEARAVTAAKEKEEP